MIMAQSMMPQLKSGDMLKEFRFTDYNWVYQQNMERSTCVVCSSKSLELSFSLNDFPKTFLPTTDPAHTDELINLDLYGCENCGGVQLKHLLDPNELYGTPHNITYDTPIWKKHHELFSDFICDNSNPTSVLEVGGYSGVLARNVLSKNQKIDYTILDICDKDPFIKNVRFINGNCEDFDFAAGVPVVMSHMFEHLYIPNKFINNLKQNSVTNVFISIPNMAAQLKNRIIPTVHQEHTFFCDYDTIVYLFAQGGYFCKSHYYYLEQSIFFHFTIDSHVIPNSSFFDKSRIKLLCDVYEKNKSSISSISVDNKEHIFICPGGIYGQLLYYYLNSDLKRNVIGFLENDPSKIGKRLYGTPFKTFKMNEVKKYESPTILFYKGPYMNEIVQQLNQYNNRIKYVFT